METRMYQSYQQPQANRGGLFVKFDTKSIQDEEASAAAGRPIFTEKEYIRIVVPGDKNSEVHRPLRLEDKEKYAAQYEHWKKGREQVAPGLPLTEWPGLAVSQVETLRYAHISTVEQLAEVSDQNLSKLGMGYEGLRQRARDYLAAAAGMAPLDALRRENDEMKSHLEMTRKQLEELRAKVASMESEAAPTGRSKPRQ
jgi:BMFP domain-containing protein YqiC